MDTYKILLIDLKDLSYKIIKVNKKIHHKYIGGYSMGLYAFKNFIDLSTKPFGIFSSIFKDIDTVPRTSYMYYENELISSSMGGNFSNLLNAISLDAIILINESASLKSIEINDEGVEFYEASDLINLNNEETFDLLAKKYDNFSSVYITKSAVNENYCSRLINDKKHGIAKGLAYFLYKKNIKSITIRGKKLNRDLNYKEKKGYINCPACPIGCKNHYKKTRPTIFDDDLKKRIDNYGLDSIALSKAIEYAKDNLNDTYKIDNLDTETLNSILDKIEENVEPYSSLANGIGYISKDKSDKNIKKRSNKLVDISKVADSLGICLFAFENYDLSYIENFVNTYTNIKLTDGKLEELLTEIKTLENSL